MFKITKSRWLLATLVFACLAAPGTAAASSSQLSLIQDDRELLGASGKDPAAVMAEAKALGVDIVRTNVIYSAVYRNPTQRTKPRDFRASDPNSPRYNWAATDRLISLAAANGIQVQLTITGPGPFFSSSSPRRCRTGRPCTYRPRPAEFAGFAAAAVRRYSGRVAYYSIYNEPNLGKTWLTPRFQSSRSGRIDVGGMLYRKLWIAGYKAVAKYDPARRNRVLFGEVAAIASPIPMLRAALCLDARGRPFRGRLAKLQGCSGRVSKLNIGGVAVHPYNVGGNGTPQTKTRLKTTLHLAYLPRLHRLMDGAARRGRIARDKGIFATEFGYQSNPPDDISNVSLSEQARYINESDRLFFGDRRVKAVAQYEVYDVPSEDQFNTGLRLVNGTAKPAYAAYRTPIVVTRRSSRSVEVYGQARPARQLTGSARTRVAVQVLQGRTWTTVTQPRTNGRGIFRVNVSRSGASSSRWRVTWQNPGTGEFLISRTARAGKRLRYYRG